MKSYQLEIQPGIFAVARLATNDRQLEEWNPKGKICAFIQDQGELTVVCEAQHTDGYDQVESGWKVLKIQGILDFSLVGVLAGIAAVLAEAGVSIFVLSTYLTDLILIKEDTLQKALSALRNADYDVIEA